MNKFKTKFGCDVYVSWCEDCDTNYGGYYCQVYRDEDMEDEIDNFVVHKEFLEENDLETLISEYVSKNIKELRPLKIGQRVFCDDGECIDNGWVSLINGKREDSVIDNDSVVYLKMENGISENEVFGKNIYIIAKEESLKFGETLCYEHHLDYDYFLPAGDENYYAGELGL